MAEPLQFFTNTVGRLVSGSITQKRVKDNDGRPIPEDEQRYEFGIAFEKRAIWDEILVGKFHPYLMSALASDPNGLQRVNAWFQNPGAKGIFSMKIGDGDAPNSKGRVNEHTKGCFVFYCNAIEPRACVVGTNADIDPAEIKLGYYVQLAGNIKPNDEPGDRAGIYLNGNILRLVAEGDVIVAGIDAETAFGGTTADGLQLPPGARPLGSGNGNAQAFGQTSLPGSGTAPAPNQTGGAPSGLPLPGASSSAQPQAPASSYTGYMGTGQPGNTGAPGLPLPGGA